jgi:hypothetical protein
MKAPWKQGMTTNPTDRTISEGSGVVLRIARANGPTIKFNGTGPVSDVQGAPPEVSAVV